MLRTPHIVISACFGIFLTFPLSAEPAAAKKDERRIPVATVPIERRTFEERLVVQGDLEARDTALVPARMPGTLMKLYVDEGDKVEAGKTALLLTDDLKLRKALELRKLDLAVSHCTVLEKLANVEREKAEAERAEKDYKRQNRLFNEDKIGTLDAVEEAESRYKKAVAEVKHAESLVALAEEQKHQATAAVEVAEKDLSDARVLAPISGVISKRFQDVGEMGGPAQPVFRIENLDNIEVCAFLPARYYGAIHPGQTRMHVGLEGTPLGEFPVSYRSPTINPKLRVFEVKCRLEKLSTEAPPGAMVQVAVVLQREEGLGVPKKSVVQRSNHDVVFLVENGRAKAVAVELGLEMDGWVLAKGDGIAAGAKVVSMGQFLLNGGTAVDVQSRPDAVAATTGSAEPTSSTVTKEN